MKAELKSLYSSDISESLKEYRPQDPTNFSFNLRMMIAPKGEAGEESFDTIVCTPTWLINEYKPSDIINGRHHLVVFEYNYSALYSYIQERIEQLEADDWNALAQKLSRIGYWEFEDYKE